MANVLKTAKSIRRKHPNKYKGKKNPWRHYVMEASAKAMGKKRKPAKKKKATRHHKRKVSAHRPAKVGRVKRKGPGKRKRHVKRKTGTRKRATRKRSTHKRRKVGSTGNGNRRSSNGGGGGSSLSSLMPVLLIGGLALIAFKMFGDKGNQQTQLPPGTPPLQLTTNPTRNTQAQNIVAYAMAGGLAVDAIIKLIQALNEKPDSEVSNIYDNINSTGGIPGYLLA